MKYQNFSLLLGFSVWLLATLVFSFFGDLFFYTENSILIVTYYTAVIPILCVLIKWVFKKYQLTGETALISIVLMAIPGMLLDVFCFKFHNIIFPKLTIKQVIILSSWVLWVYVIVLLFGLYLRKQKIAF